MAGWSGGAAAAVAVAKAAAPQASPPPTRDHIVLYVNGTRHEISAAVAAGIGRNDDLPGTTLLEFLRGPLVRQRGTKFGCGVGQCGACTVMLSRCCDTPSEEGGRSDGGGVVVTHTVNACMYPLMMCDGASVTTVEGIGDSAHPHPIQERMARLHASQCGFCSPGFIMSMYAALASSDMGEAHAPTSEDMEASVQGNICRCTGYRPILDVAKTLGCDFHDEPPAPAILDEQAGRTSTTLKSANKLSAIDSSIDDRPLTSAAITAALRAKPTIPKEVRRNGMLLRQSPLAISSVTAGTPHQRSVRQAVGWLGWMEGCGGRFICRSYPPHCCATACHRATCMSHAVVDQSARTPTPPDDSCCCWLVGS